MQADARFLQTEAYPGDAVELELRAAAGSLCAVGVVDRSVYAVQAEEALTAEKVRREWEGERGEGERDGREGDGREREREIERGGGVGEERETERDGRDMGGRGRGREGM